MDELVYQFQSHPFLVLLGIFLLLVYAISITIEETKDDRKD